MNNLDEARGKLISRMSDLDLKLNEIHDSMEIAVSDFSDSCGIESVRNDCKLFIEHMNDNLESFEMMKRSLCDTVMSADPYPFRDKAIFEYLKVINPASGYNQNVGCIYAEKIYIESTPIVSIGISILHKEDKFDKKVGFIVARNRARRYNGTYSIKFTNTSYLTRYTLKTYIQKFIERCKKWFSNTPILYPSNIRMIYHGDNREEIVE